MTYDVYFHECAYKKWTWHDLYLELVLHLCDNHEIILHYDKGTEVREDPYNPSHMTSVPKLYIEKYNYHLPDTDLIIYDQTNDVLKGISFAESRTKLFDIFMERANPNDILLITQQNNVFFSHINEHGKIPEFPFKLKRTTFYPFDPMFNMEFFFHERKFRSPETFIDKMVCLTTPSTDRRDLPKLHELGILDYGTGYSYDGYLMNLINYKIGLAIAGSAEICHREFEYMALGIPMIRLEYMTQLEPRLIPNYHYIAVDISNFPKDMWLHRYGGDEYVEAYKNKFMEVKDDREFLNFIAKNARQYYTENCAPHIRLTRLLELLEIPISHETTIL